MSDIYNRVLVSEDLPTAVSDENWKGQRANKRGEPFSQEMGRWRSNAAREGTYFVAHDPTIDVATTLVGHAAPVLVDGDATLTKPILVGRHTGATGTALAELDYIQIDVIVAGASGTSDHWTMQLDTGTTRYASGTVIDLVAVNPNMQSSATPNLGWKAGPYVAGAETASCRVLGFGTFKSTIELAGDRYIWNFGGDVTGENKVSAAASIYQITMPPVILGPTDSILLALWQVAQNAAGIYKIRVGWRER